MKHEPFVVFPTRDGQVVVNPEKIISICSNYKMSFIKLLNNVELTINMGIGDVHEQLDESIFIRCHRSCIVNLFQIRKICDNYVCLLLKDGTEVSISRRNKTVFKRAFENFQVKWAMNRKKNYMLKKVSF